MKIKIFFLTASLIGTAGICAAREENFFSTADLIRNHREIRQWQKWMGSIIEYVEESRKTVKTVKIGFLDIHLQVKESKGELSFEMIRKIKEFKQRLDTLVRELREKQPPAKLLKYHLFIIEYFRLLEESQEDLLVKDFPSYSGKIRQARIMFLRATDTLLQTLQEQGAPPDVLRIDESERKTQS